LSFFQTGLHNQMEMVGNLTLSFAALSMSELIFAKLQRKFNIVRGML